MFQSKHALFVACLGLLLAGLASSGGCGGGGSSSTYNPSASSGGGTSSGAGAGNISLDGGPFGQMSTCTNGQGWSCKVDQSCAGGPSQTTLSGKVFDPAGRNPLYDVIVFIPNDASTLPAIQPGTHTCNTCDVSIGGYVAATTTDYTGSFTLKGVPTGSNVPVTVQIGKWRRTVTVNIASSCGSNTINDGVLRLPKKRSEGDMPQMAVLTGGCDDLGCFLNGIGIDASEFSAPQGGGRLDVYQGVGQGGGGFGGGGGAATLSNGTAGNCTAASCPLWSSKASLENYDIVLLSCECAENRQTKPAAGQQALHDWLGEGGKVFASHYHYTWFRDSPAADFQGVANWGMQGNADTVTSQPGNGAGAYDVDTSFPKGAIFGQWLSLVGALQSAGPPPTINLNPVADSVVSVNAPTVRWIYGPAASTNVKYMSFQTPIGGVPAPNGEGPPAYCGKAVFTDLHTGGETQSTVASIPNGCPGGALSAQQKALEFLFFDLSACVSNDMAPPPMPPPPPQ